MTAFSHRFVLLLITAYCLMAGRLFPQAPAWVDVSGRPGFSLLSELSDGTLFGLVDDILYRSFDGGVTWENFPRPGGPVQEFTAGPDLAVIVVFVADVFNNRQFFTSTDRGNTWERIYGERSFPISSIHQNVMVAPWGEIYSLEYSEMRATVQRYTNGRWEPLGVASGVLAGPYVAPFTVSAIDGAGTFYIGTLTDGIHSTRDNGETWTKTLPYREITAIETAGDGSVYIASRPNARTNGGVYRTRDRGLTWEAIGLTNTTVTDLAVDTAGNLFAVSPSGLFRYAGDTGWDGLGPFDFAYDILHVTRSEKYYATAPGLGMLISSDGGENWNLDGVRQQDIYSVCGTNDGSILAGTLGEGVFRSTSGGAIWKQYKGPGVPEYFYTLYRYGNGVFAGTENGLYRSDDNGQTWTFLTEPLNILQASMPVYTVTIRPDGILCIGTGSGVYSSPDGGVTWAEAGLQFARVLGLCDGPDGTLYAATAASGIFASSDGGSTWSGRGLVRPDVQSMAVNDAGQIVVGVYGGVYRSTDGGTTWNWRIFTQGHVYAMLFNGNHQLFAATSNGMFVSNDGGDLWSAAGLDREFVVSLGYDRYHAMLAGVYKGGIFTTSGIITPVTGRESVPSSARLFQNYPNPFNPRTTIVYEVARTSDVTVTVYDLLGREVARLVSGRESPGIHTTVWDADDHPSGIYYYRVRITPAGGVSGPAATAPDRGSLDELRKMVLVK